ncbi:MAG TPA: VWA domain-containing protein [Candidatus Dormibacteraeota bacterium]|jgi:Ca-activated chloride channel family protein|nr:VWA domain-containing protein [Candidatus Dormibacteraeota bacterium]
MSFLSPWLLLGLLAVPLLIGLYLTTQKRRQAYAVRFTNLALLNQVVGKGPGFRRHLPAILFIAGLAGLLVSMARPQAVIRIPKGQTSVMLAVDVSGSMAATDVQPTRIDAAISAGRTLIDKLPSNAQVGLVIFNAQAQVIAPLTSDKGSVKDALGTLSPGGGTAIGSAIEASVAQLANIVDPNGPKSQNYARVILLTDGSSNTGVDNSTAAADAARAHIQVDTIGIGSKNQTVLVQGIAVDGVDEQALQSVASATGGHYYYASDEAQLSKIYSDLGSHIGWVTSKVDLTVPVLALGTLILVIGGLFSLRWFRLLP